MNTGGEVVGITLETIDLADPARAGVADTVAVPRITAEQVDTDSKQEETPVPPDKQESPISIAEMDAMKAERDLKAMGKVTGTEDLYEIEKAKEKVDELKKYLNELKSERSSIKMYRKPGQYTKGKGKTETISQEPVQPQISDEEIKVQIPTATPDQIIAFKRLLGATNPETKKLWTIEDI